MVKCWSVFFVGSGGHHDLILNFLYHILLLSSRLLSRNLNIKIFRTIILPVVCMGVKLGR